MTIEIFIPFYGDGALLSEAIRSVINQTCSRWKLIVIDDAYPEKIAEQIVNSYTDSRVHFIRNQENHGVSGVFQQALELSQTEYLVIMGFDDRLKPGYINKMMAIIDENPGLSYIQPGVSVIDENGNPHSPAGDKIKQAMKKKYNPPTVLSGEKLASSLMKGNWTYFPSICWKSSAIKNVGFRQDMQIALDLSLQLELIKSGEKMYLDKEETFEYRRHKKSASSWTAADGSRFLEEKRLFSENRLDFKRLKWRQASRHAAMHITSRVNAISHLPRAFFRCKWASCLLLLKHAFL